MGTGLRTLRTEVAALCRAFCSCLCGKAWELRDSLITLPTGDQPSLPLRAGCARLVECPRRRAGTVMGKAHSLCAWTGTTRHGMTLPKGEACGVGRSGGRACSCAFPPLPPSPHPAPWPGAWRGPLTPHWILCPAQLGVAGSAGEGALKMDSLQWGTATWPS